MGVVDDEQISDHSNLPAAATDNLSVRAYAIDRQGSIKYRHRRRFV